MAKKTTARPAAKPSQQRSKEDQWRRRMAQQSQMGASSSTVAEPGVDMDSASGAEVGVGATQAAAGRAARAASGSAAKRATNVSAVTQRANLAGARSARVRLSASTLPLAEEMHYIRGDIVKLGILTAICLVLLFALAFIVPMIIK